MTVVTGVVWMRGCGIVRHVRRAELKQQRGRQRKHQRLTGPRALSAGSSSGNVRHSPACMCNCQLITPRTAASLVAACFIPITHLLSLDFSTQGLSFAAHSLPAGVP
jgi:hypothetical protein